jgi:hypothetical protein
VPFADLVGSGFAPRRRRYRHLTVLAGGK